MESSSLDINVEDQWEEIGTATRRRDACRATIRHISAALQHHFTRKLRPVVGAAGDAYVQVIESNCRTADPVVEGTSNGLSDRYPVAGCGLF